MLAVCYHYGWDGVSLFVNRLSLLAVSVFALVVLYRLWRLGRDTTRRVVVPLPILAFTLVWVLQLLGATAYLIVSPCQSPIPLLPRTILGASTAWSLGGMTWIVACGARYIHRLRAVATTPVAQVLSEVASKAGNVQLTTSDSEK